MYSKKDEMNFPALFLACIKKESKIAGTDSHTVENGRKNAKEKGKYGSV